MPESGDDMSREESNFSLLTVYFNRVLALDASNVDFNV